ncbi:MAG TPA: hypothetical protein VFU80_05430 [Sphingomicrobium sp.]|nr:hypothetical protein [Sphingomicrobium sp.]
MRVLLGIVFWTLAAIEGLWLLFMLFVSLAAGPRMAENGDVATPLFWNVLLPLAALIGAILLFARGRAPVMRAIALLVVVAPVIWLLTWTEGETIRTTFVDPAPPTESR